VQCGAEDWLARTTINGRADMETEAGRQEKRGEVSAADLDRARDYAVPGRGGR